MKLENRDMESTIVIRDLTIGYRNKKTLCGFLTKRGGEITVMGKEQGSYTPKDLSTLMGVVLTDTK